MLHGLIHHVLQLDSKVSNIRPFLLARRLSFDVPSCKLWLSYALGRRQNFCFLFILSPSLNEIHSERIRYERTSSLIPPSRASITDLPFIWSFSCATACYHVCALTGLISLAASYLDLDDGHYCISQYNLMIEFQIRYMTIHGPVWNHSGEASSRAH